MTTPDQPPTQPNIPRQRTDEPPGDTLRDLVAALVSEALAAAQPASSPARKSSRRRDQRRAPDEERLTLDEVCDDLRISRSTFYDWRAKNKAPRCIKLPNGEIRIRQAEFDRWLSEREDAA
jgi:predicted DNA-binding transcriptional regulator AlpA